jgi:hypothetical protein
LLPSHVSACGVRAGEGNRRRSMIVENFKLPGQHRFEFKSTQQRRNQLVVRWIIFTAGDQMKKTKLSSIDRSFEHGQIRYNLQTL